MGTAASRARHAKDDTIVEACCTDINRVGSQGVHVSRDGTLASAHVSTVPDNYYLARNGIKGGVNMDRGGFAVMHDGARVACVYDGVSSGGLINLYAAQTFARQTIEWVAARHRSFLSTGQQGTAKLAADLFRYLQGREHNPVTRNPRWDAAGGAATGVFAVLARDRHGRDDSCVLTGAAIGDAALLVLNLARHTRPGGEVVVPPVVPSMPASAVRRRSIDRDQGGAGAGRDGSAHVAGGSASPPSEARAAESPRLDEATGADTQDALRTGLREAHARNLFTVTQVNTVNRRGGSASDSGGQLEVESFGGRINGTPSPFSVRMRVGDLAVMASDGLTDNIAEGEMSAIVSAVVTSPAFDAEVALPCPWSVPADARLPRGSELVDWLVEGACGVFPSTPRADAPPDTATGSGSDAPSAVGAGSGPMTTLDTTDPRVRATLQRLAEPPTSAEDVTPHVAVQRLSWYVDWVTAEARRMQDAGYLAQARLSRKLRETFVASQGADAAESSGAVVAADGEEASGGEASGGEVSGEASGGTSGEASGEAVGEPAAAEGDARTLPSSDATSSGDDAGGDESVADPIATDSFVTVAELEADLKRATTYAASRKWAGKTDDAMIVAMQQPFVYPTLWDKAKEEDMLDRVEGLGM